MTSGTGDHGAAPNGSATDRPVRAQERRRLTAELHDHVTHHLANVALRTMGPLDRLDADDLRTILGEVNDAAGSALVELRLLARVLADRPERPAGAGQGLTRDRTPRTAAAAWRLRLLRAGLLAEHVVPEAADRVPRSVQLTILRALEATAEVALRHAAAGSRCSVTVHVEAARVLVHSAIRPPPAGPSGGGPGVLLAALRERVDLTRGQLAVEVTERVTGPAQWNLTILLPLD